MMKSKLLNSLILTALAVPGVAMAADAPPITGNVALVTNYLYRGLTQTGGNGAIQGGFDYTHSSGFYAGVWGSNISWLSDAGVTRASLELDTYLGITNTFATDFNYNVGFLRYNYGGGYPAGTPSANTNEAYGALGWKWLTAKYSYALTNLFGFTDSSGSGYAELNASYMMEGPAVTLSAHYGKQTVKNNSGAEYSDYNVKAAKDFSGFTLGLLVSKTNLDAYKDTKAVFSVSHTM